MPEEQDTCVNTPQLPSPTLELPAIKQNHLMDTLATLALSSESQPAPWDYAAFNPMYQIPSPFSMFTAQAAEQPQVQSQQTQQRYGILDPNVGDKTLLQATNFDDLNFPGSFE